MKRKLIEDLVHWTVKIYQEFLKNSSINTYFWISMDGINFVFRCPAIVRWPSQAPHWRRHAAAPHSCSSWVCWRSSSDPNAIWRTPAADPIRSRKFPWNTTSLWSGADRRGRWWRADSPKYQNGGSSLWKRVRCSVLTASRIVVTWFLVAGPDEPTGTQVPSMFLNFIGSDIDWGYNTEPEKQACLGEMNQQCYWPRGKVNGPSPKILLKCFLAW